MIHGARGTGGRWPTWRGDLVFAAAAVALFALLVIRFLPGLMHGALVDPDGYMRLVRVRRLAETRAWFDGTIPRSNAPWGDTLHWTRPMDVLILLGAWALEPFVRFQVALHWSGVAVAPLLLIAVCFVTAWAVRPLVGAGLRYVTMLAVLAQAGIMGYALPGRADHNMLILLAFAAMFGSALRLLLEPEARWASWATGAWAGFGLWLTVESLAPLFVLLVSLAGLWVVKGEVAGAARSVALGTVAVVAVAVVLEHPPGALLMVEYDRVSVVQLFAVALVLAFWAVAASPWAARLGVVGRAALATARRRRRRGGHARGLAPVLRESDGDSTPGAEAHMARLRLGDAGVPGPAKPRRCWPARCLPGQRAARARDGGSRHAEGPDTDRSSGSGSCSAQA